MFERGLFSASLALMLKYFAHNTLMHAPLTKSPHIVWAFIFAVIYVPIYYIHTFQWLLHTSPHSPSEHLVSGGSKSNTSLKACRATHYLCHISHCN